MFPSVASFAHFAEMESEAYEILLLTLDVIRLDVVVKDPAAKAVAAQLVQTSVGTSPATRGAARMSLLADYLSKELPWIPQDVWLVLDLYRTSVQIAEQPELLGTGALRSLEEFATELTHFGIDDAAAASHIPSAAACQAVRSVGAPLLVVVRRILLESANRSPEDTLLLRADDVTELIRALRRVVANRATMAVVTLAPILNSTGVDGAGPFTFSESNFVRARGLLETLVRFGRREAPQPIAASRGPLHSVSTTAVLSTNGKRARCEGTTVATPQADHFKQQLVELFDTPPPRTTPASVPLFRDESVDAVDSSRATSEGVTPPRCQPALLLPSEEGTSPGRKTTPAPMSLPVGSIQSAAVGPRRLLVHEEPSAIYADEGHHDVSAASSGLLDASIQVQDSVAPERVPRTKTLFAPDASREIPHDAPTDQARGPLPPTGPHAADIALAPASSNVPALSGSRTYILAPTIQRYVPISVVGFFD